MHRIILLGRLRRSQLAFDTTALYSLRSNYSLQLVTFSRKSVGRTRQCRFSTRNLTFFTKSVGTRHVQSPLLPDTAMPFPYPKSNIFYQICGPDTAMPFPYPKSDIFTKSVGTRQCRFPTRNLTLSVGTRKCRFPTRNLTFFTKSVGTRHVQSPLRPDLLISLVLIAIGAQPHRQRNMFKIDSVVICRNAVNPLLLVADIRANIEVNCSGHDIFSRFKSLSERNLRSLVRSTLPEAGHHE